MSDRILFLCGSLVPGKDGVGDYARKMAAELIAGGTGVRLLATHDKGVAETTEEEQREGTVAVPVVRIPYGAPQQERIRRIQDSIDGYHPGLLSLQYVPYSFSPYGLPFSLIQQLRSLRYRGRWHVMFHELWIKNQGVRTPKDTVVSALQRLAVLGLTKVLRPAVIHTHIPYYQAQLKQLGITARPLPLFANIAPQVGTAGPDSGGGSFRLGFFSQFIPERVIPFIRSLDTWLRTTDGRKLDIQLLGGGADRVAETRRILAAEFPQATINASGFLSAEALSRELSRLDLGITPVDHHLIGKSGTVAAFLNHGIPVAAPYRTEHAPSFFTPGLTAATLETFSETGLLSAMRAAGSLDTHPISPQGVARCFLNDLSLSPAHNFISSNSSPGSDY
ncbi:glycosyltransferase family protein [Neolewinella litorea]|uniref:Glycosyltransferase family 1 protein n=1 Tax=Neolewinella litorea TaxID=2562452 RepID=A0A4S4NK21_9BACT|nr:glycosyltransferase [Neolewinella litorea]THH39285.1 glycosyltransferase family 1 protein [Neolewinella litorea]